jgi:hypothetical protein
VRERLRIIYLGRCRMCAPGAQHPSPTNPLPQVLDDALAEGPPTHLGWGVSLGEGPLPRPITLIPLKCEAIRMCEAHS